MGRRFILLLAGLCFLLGLAHGRSVRLSPAALPRKNLAGPASEFGSKQLPRPQESALECVMNLLREPGLTYVPSEQSALFKVNFNPSSADTVICFSQSLLVDSPDSFAFSLFLPDEDQVTFHLYSPASEEVSLQEHEVVGTFPLGDSGSGAPAATYYFSSPYQPGMWTLTGECASGLKRAALPDPDLEILLWNQATVRVYSELSSFNMTEGRDVGLVAMIYDPKTDSTWRREKRRPRQALAGGQIWIAEMKVVTPKGRTVDVTMHDDGQHNDAAAGDGVYGALLRAAEVGTYSAQASFTGFTNQGLQFVRTSQHLLRVMPANVNLTTSALGVPQGDGTIDILLGVSYAETDVAESVTAYAEVWGTAKNGSVVPVAWIGGAVDVADYKGKHVLPLVLNSKWLARASARDPLYLRNVYTQNQLIPISQQAQMTVKLTSELPALDHIVADEIDEEMRWGKRPARFQRRTGAAAADKPNLILAHGYCAQLNPFAEHASDFTNAILLDDLDASRTNDEFANIIAQFAQDQGLDSFGLVAHSQGGLASTHLHNYYWSGLETAVGLRLIQSVGSPYMGSGLAGSTADLGKIFGVGCGGQFDITHDGANLWLTGLASSGATKDVYYYTTQYQDNGLVNYCNLGSNLILKWPNDGMTELQFSTLPGGNPMGHTKGECHTLSMKYPPQCWDSSRNAEMNGKAAR